MILRSGFYKDDKMLGRKAIRAKDTLVNFNWFLFIFILTVSCGENREEHLSYLSNNLEKLENLQRTIESRYGYILSDSTDNRNRIVFIDCEVEGNLSKDYFCNDKLILEIMKELELREVRFEKKGTPCVKSSMYNEVYFQRKKINYSPIVYYMYEYCGTGKVFESQTIFYSPIDSHWSVYIDSNYP